MKGSYPYLKMLEKKNDFIFLTDHGKKNLFRDLRINVLDLIAERKFLKIFPQWLLEGLFLFFIGLVKKNVVFVTFGTNKRTYVLMALQQLFRAFITPKVHVMFDCLWEPMKGIFGKIIISVRRYLVNNVVEKCIVYGSSDIESFNQELGISKDRLFFFPYHHTLQGFEYNVKDGNYIFSGGTDGRDYDLLMKICDELSLPLKIATLDQNVIRRARKYLLAEVKSVTSKEFRDLMAGSRIVTIPYGKSILRTGGHQSMINAMLMGKPLVCYNEAIVEGYVENNKTGITIQYGNVAEYKKVLHELYHSNEKRENLGQAAKQWVIDERLTQTDWIQKIYDYAASFYYNKKHL